MSFLKTPLLHVCSRYVLDLNKFLFVRSSQKKIFKRNFRIRQKLHFFGDRSIFFLDPSKEDIFFRKLKELRTDKNFRKIKITSWEIYSRLHILWSNNIIIYYLFIFKNLFSQIRALAISNWGAYEILKA